MDQRNLKYDALMLLTACIWGFAFVAQKYGMEYVGPFTFNGVRFLLGGLILLPFLNKGDRVADDKKLSQISPAVFWWGGFLAGLVLFFGSALQQMGLTYDTSAGDAGFITGLYVILVPILGLLLGHHTNMGTWAGALLAAAGMYLLSVTDQMTIGKGDLLVLVSAFFWAGHIMIIAWLSPRIASMKLAVMQYMTCAALSLLIAVFWETMTLSGLYKAMLPILYGGVMSVGVAYTLQVVAQKKAHPAHAAILLSLETVFAAIGGWLLLNETFSGRQMTGFALMLSGMLLSQLHGLWKSKQR